MDAASPPALLETTLTRAADMLGDVTPAVMTRFYARWPEARATFEALSPGRREVLEGEMIERVLYCLMQWHDYPGEIEIMLFGSVPHHAQTLNVPAEWYGGLLAMAMEVIGETIPADRADETGCWSDLRSDLAALVEQSSQFI